MIIGKLNAEQGIAVSTTGEFFILDIGEPWITKSLDESPPEEESDPINIFPIFIPLITKGA